MCKTLVSVRGTLGIFVERLLIWSRQWLTKKREKKGKTTLHSSRPPPFYNPLLSTAPDGSKHQ
jgi:hypothetical protein